MLKSYTSNRIIFKQGEQGKFFVACRIKLGLNRILLAKIMGVTSRTLHDWENEIHRMPYISAVKLSKRSNIPLPKNIKILEWTEHLRKIGKTGGIAQYVKYGSIGNETKRREAWLAWWNKEGRYKGLKILQKREIRIPPRDIHLAEFVGIVMGDGCITDYVVKVTFDTLADSEYISYVISLMKKLFNVIPTIYNHKNKRATDIIVQRKNLVDFCVSIGLKRGNKIKQNIDIPDWIKNDRDYSIACIRGLVDTDGCFFNHSYKVNGRRYNYTKIAFTNRCSLILKSVRMILINLGFCVRMTKDGNDVRIENREDVKRYIKVIGTNNPKFKNKII